MTHTERKLLISKQAGHLIVNNVALEGEQTAPKGRLKPMLERFQHHSIISSTAIIYQFHDLIVLARYPKATRFNLHGMPVRADSPVENTPMTQATYMVHALPAFYDNYIWVIERCSDGHVVVIDPGDATVVLDWLAEHSFTLKAILITHKHADHIGGIAKLTQFTPVPVHGNLTSSHLITHGISAGDEIEVIGLKMQVLDLKGHTLDHIGFFATAENNIPEPWLFCGDTLFSAGCGRLFEGSPSQMLTALDKIAELPRQTQIYPAHEYTCANIQFALHVNPGNAELHNYASVCHQQRAKGLRTLPTTLAMELAVNPFLRCQDQEIISIVCQHLNKTDANSRLSVFTSLRAWKDVFKTN